MALEAAVVVVGGGEGHKRERSEDVLPFSIELFGLDYINNQPRLP